MKTDYSHDIMVKKIRRVPAGEFKAKCLKLLDEVAATGEEIVVTKRGKPVARVLPVGSRVARPLLGSVLEEHDIVSPSDEEWEMEK